MKKTYGITLQDFWSLQPQLILRPAKNLGFKALVVFCALFAGFGVYCIVEGLGDAVGGFIIGLSAVALGIAYVFEKRSVAENKKKYENSVTAAYAGLHCRESREFEADDSGFSFRCNCGAVTRPWSELVIFSESKSLFVLGTKTERHLLPKTAFLTAGDVTEFRAFVSSKLHNGGFPEAARVEFNYTKKDHRNAFLLRTFKAGGWKSFAWNLFLVVCSISVVERIWKSTDPAIACGLIALPVFLLLKIAAPLLRKKYLGKIRIDFSESGLFIEDPVSSTRAGWSQFIGYLENDKVYLLYHNPRLYRLIPKRATGNRDSAVRELIRAKLPNYDYKNPVTLRSR